MSITTTTVPPSIERIDHVAITVRNLENAFQFYREVLGLEELQTPPDAAAKRIIWMKIPGGGMLHLVETPEPIPATLAHFALRVKNIDDWHVHLKNQEIELIDIPINVPGVKRLYVRDPSGNLFEFIEWADES